ncbi:hypothetical protein BOTBODRAFT_164801 [Botryobasidium botryosum FD-172 SS1]|uniref:CsbD-like domain-containing protein n=1 Tax=Botryobasidium botryosum (strain FD-172 SS1) TaxID=930990 RepID=A0A067MD15_BOTB1|nr:hypothetical protein BOTBODRAFT_164801 [Botryobasidium botryosum FD-172 SS1]
MPSNNNSASKVSGQLNSVAGTLQETVGNLIGSKDMSRKGATRHTQGEAEISRAKAGGYVQGATDRITGKKDAIMGSVRGDKSRQAQGNARHDKGQVKVSAH